MPANIGPGQTFDPTAYPRPVRPLSSLPAPAIAWCSYCGRSWPTFGATGVLTWHAAHLASECPSTHPKGDAA